MKLTQTIPMDFVQCGKSLETITDGHRSRFVILFEHQSQDSDESVRHLRALLKYSLRVFGFRCISCEPSRPITHHRVSSGRDDGNRSPLTKDEKVKLPKPEAQYSLIPAGTYAAVCSRVLDLGTQSGNYQGKITRQRKIYLELQIPSERNEDGEPLAIGNRYTLSGSEKSNLRKDLESWRGKRFQDSDFEGDSAFDIRNVLGKPCMVNVVHNDRDGKTYADIAGLSPLMKGLPKPELEGSPVYFSLDPSVFDQQVFDGLSDRLKETIAKSPEYAFLCDLSVRDHDGVDTDHRHDGDGGDGIP